MTERFSPEYIAFILSDEAKGLQKRHKWQVGDWYTYGRHGRSFLLDDRGLEDLQQYKFKPAWLPTLTDLLGMIEEAGWRWGGYKRDPHHSHEHGTGYVWYCQDDWDGLCHVDPEEDKLLAAAKLAVRVLQGKGGPPG